MKRHYCFTLNNYTEEEYDKIKSNLINYKKTKYFILGKEIGEKKETPHIQGFIQYTAQTSWKQTMKVIDNSRIHLEPCKGSPYSNYMYCSKENNYYEYKPENRPTGQGKRQDIKSIKKDIEEGIEKYTLEELIIQHGDNYQKIRYIENYYKIYKNNHISKTVQKDFLNIELNDSQKEWLELIKNQHSRKVNFIVDYQGGLGKSYFSSYMVHNHKTLLITGGKNKDLSYLVENQEYAVFDIPRTGEINYSFIESLKNGFITSTKYQTMTKLFKPMKILVFTNKYPDTSQLSKDRYEIKEYNKPYDIIYDSSEEDPELR